LRRGVASDLFDSRSFTARAPRLFPRERAPSDGSDDEQRRGDGGSIERAAEARREERDRVVAPRLILRAADPDALNVERAATASLAQRREQRGFDASGRFPLAHRRAHLAQRGRERALAPESRGARRARCGVRVRRFARSGV
jgi:hypothetical protein